MFVKSIVLIEIESGAFSVGQIILHMVVDDTVASCINVWKFEISPDIHLEISSTTLSCYVSVIPVAYELDALFCDKRITCNSYSYISVWRSQSS